MFTHLIESGSHKKDAARRGRFFLGTLGFYALLLSIAGVASVYAYDSHLGKQNLELYTLVAVPLPPAEAPVPEQRQPASGGARRSELPQRREAIAPLLDNIRPPENISTVRNNSAELPRNRAYTITGRDVDPPEGGALGTPSNINYSSHTNRNAVVVPAERADDPPPPTPTPAPVKPPAQIRVASSVISSKVISKPAPVYPAIAKQTGVQGTVSVEILVDEGGRVISARATTGHPLLRLAAQQSAYQARFTPTTISGSPVKVSGVITYNFILQ
ncbi:MAG TPA: energy transducer TonB [Pyrinomonadaceae bacterium]|nr:energy transducer TonB [Pyrinomonadaceae bacterium]